MLVGDLDFDKVMDKVEAISPTLVVVVPITIAMLMKNTVKAARQQMVELRTSN